MLLTAYQKLNDMGLNERLSQCCAVSGAGRSTGEARLPKAYSYIDALCLLCDIARRKNYTLFVSFVDFSKAYDFVNRKVLFETLKRLGCGYSLLC